LIHNGVMAIVGAGLEKNEACAWIGNWSQREGFRVDFRIDFFRQGVKKIKKPKEHSLGTTSQSQNARAVSSENQIPSRRKPASDKPHHRQTRCRKPRKYERGPLTTPPVGRRKYVTAPESPPTQESHGLLSSHLLSNGGVNGGNSM